MPTLIGIALAAAFVAARWIYCHSSKKQEVKPQTVDTDLTNALNQGDRHD